VVIRHTTPAVFRAILEYLYTDVAGPRTPFPSRLNCLPHCPLNHSSYHKTRAGFIIILVRTSENTPPHNTKYKGLV